MTFFSQFSANIFQNMRDEMKHAIAEMIFIIRPTEVSRYRSCQTTPCKSYCPLMQKITFLAVFSQYLEN